MILFDFHLHWYPGFQIDRFRSRLESVAGDYPIVVGVIYDTELCRCWDDFPVAWQSLPLVNREENSSRLSGDWGEGGTRFLFYRGEQRVSEENIELLVIGATPETGPLETMVAETLAAGGVALLPWGFGKWRGARGQLVKRELDRPRPGLFLSDSGNRPTDGFGASFISGILNEFSETARLDGSDPLPMPGEEDFAFSLGMRGPRWESEPPNSFALAEALIRMQPSLETAGSLRSVSDSVSRQICLRRNGFSLQPASIPSAPGLSDAGDIESATDRYARRFSGTVGAYFLERQAELTMALAGRDRATKKEVLDIGGGHAQLAPHFLKEGWSVSIFASSEECRKRPDRILGSENYRFAYGDLLFLPYPDDSFEVVTLFRLVPHETDWESLIAEAARVARHRVILDYPDLRSFNFLSRMLFVVKKAVEKDTRDYDLFTRKKIAGAMERAGLSQLKFRPQFFMPMALYRLVGSGRFAVICEKIFRLVGLTSLFGSPVIVSGEKQESS